MAHFAPTTRRFDHVHVDLVGRLPPSQNHRYLFTVVDRFTRWAGAIPLDDHHRCEGLCCSLGGSFRCASGHDVGQRITVHVSIVAASIATTRYTITPHLRVPPTVEQTCGKISQTPQICTDGSSRWPYWLDKVPCVLLGIHTAANVFVHRDSQRPTIANVHPSHRLTGDPTRY